METSVTVTSCEKEPIHIPGSIQPFGIVFVMDLHFDVLQVSANAETELSTPSSEILNKNLSQLIAKDQFLRIKTALSEGTESAENPFLLSFKSCPKWLWESFVHRLEDRIILEVEHFMIHDLDLNFRKQVNLATSLIEGTQTVVDLCQTAAEEIQKVSGYDRVMIYRFDESWNGKVIAEARRDISVDSYMGHHFPASDIPPQARAVFLANWLRMIPDVNYRPAPLFPIKDPITHRPTDLSRTFLRSVSPIHIQYLKNMNVSATMTISLIREGKLWGLVACHHSVPRLISTDIRSCCKFIGKLVSSQLRTKEEIEDLDYKTHLIDIYKNLVENMKREKSITAGLFKHTPNLVDLIGSGGAAAAIQIEGEWTLIGKTPSVEQIDRLAEWLIESGHDKDIFTTRNLSSLFPEAEAYKNVASGLAAITIPKTRKSFIFWFRPEVIETVTWAGNPTKNIEILPDGTIKIDPRASFDGWKETVRNQSIPWRKPEIEAITSLRHSIIELDLQQQFDQEQKGRRELETEKSKMDLVMNNLPVFMWAMSNNGDFTYLAGRELTHLGYDTKSLVGQNYQKIFGASAEIIRGVNLALGGEVALADVRLKNKTYRTYFAPFFDRDGKISGITAISRNVSEVAETEAALRASENRYELLVDSVRDYAIFTVNTDGLITSWNKGAEKVLGYSEKEVLGKSAELIYSNVDGHQRLQEKEMQIALQTGEARDDGWHTKKNGKQFWGSGTLTPIFNHHKELTGYVKILRDLTDKKLAEDQMREALRLRDEFLSVASHELKTPLTSLKLQTQLYKRSNDKSNSTYDRSQVDKMVDLTERQVQRLNRLVDDMLDISRIRSGKLSIKRETFDLCELIKETMERLRPMFISAGCGEPTLVTCDDVEGSWDKMRIDQVLTNLLTNAIRYGRGWPVEIRVTRTESKVTIAVRDQGMGIDKKNHDRIFESYERASNDVSGLGLGLFITKQIIAAHGGRIWVESELNQGATFLVELPLGLDLTRDGAGRE